MIAIILRWLFTVFFIGAYSGSKSAYEEPVITNTPMTIVCYEKEQKAILALEKKILKSQATKHTFVLEDIKECGLTAEYLYLKAMKRAEKNPLYKIKN